MKFTFSLGLYISAILCFSQEKLIDSLKSDLQKETSLEKKIILYDEIGYQLSSNNPLLALKYADSAVSTSLIINDQDLIAKSYNGKSIPLIRLGKFDEAIMALKDASKANDHTDNLRRKGAIYTKIGVAFQEQNQIDSAQQYYLNAAYIFDSLKDSLAIAQVYDNLAAVYERLNDFEKSISYNKKSLPILKKYKFKYGIAVNYGNQSILFRKKGEIDSALFYINNSIQLFSDINALEEKSTAFINKGIILKQMGNLSESLKSQQAALAIAINLKDSANMGYSLLDIGSLQIELNEFQEAKESLQEALIIAELLKINRIAIPAHEGLMTISIMEGNSETALYHKERFLHYKDSTYNITKEKAIRELETQYQTEKKEQQIALQEAQLSEKESDLQRNRILIISLLIVVVLIISLWLLNRNRLKKKQELDLQQERLIAQEAEINAAISSQEKERARYARDLHDGFGQMISILNMNIKNLEGSPKPDERQKVFEESEKVIGEMYDELKSICFDLMPQTLVKNGVGAAINEFASRINTTGKINLETNFFGLDARLLEVIEISLYRITQEWVNNILKYSDADKITIQITQDEEELNLIIEDNGIGFNKSLLTNGQGNGWKNIKTRSKLIEGNIDLDTVEGRKGTSLILTAASKKLLEKQKNTLEKV